MDYEKQFGKRLAELRAKKGVSAREMSLAVGQSHGHVNGIESGKNFPRMATFFYMCEYLNVTPKEFFDFDMNDPHGVSEVYEKIKHLTPEQLKALESIIDQMK